MDDEPDNWIVLSALTQNVVAFLRMIKKPCDEVTRLEAVEDLSNGLDEDVSGPDR